MPGVYALVAVPGAPGGAPPVELSGTAHFAYVLDADTLVLGPDGALERRQRMHYYFYGDLNTPPSGRYDTAYSQRAAGTWAARGTGVELRWTAGGADTAYQARAGVLTVNRVIGFYGGGTFPFRYERGAGTAAP